MRYCFKFILRFRIEICLVSEKMKGKKKASIFRSNSAVAVFSFFLPICFNASVWLSKGKVWNFGSFFFPLFCFSGR
ncbi:hypothetical protein WN943_008660 [Citrus x changshan-huyou]